MIPAPASRIATRVRVVGQPSARARRELPLRRCREPGRASFGTAARFALGLFVGLQFPFSSHAQLAITEVMSEASPTSSPKRPDFWELTNFGRERIDLTPYRWIDSAGFEAAEPQFFAGHSIGPGESIVLCRSNVTTTLTATDFHEWWGLQNESPLLQVLFYRGPGFSPDYDAVQLWRVTASATTLVDRVEFYAATPGATFVYDPLTGEFDTVSRVGAGVAFRAVLSEDVGSPGRTTGPAPLRILEPPAALEVDAGSPATFTVRSAGMPKTRYQWLRNGKPIPGATGPTLAISNAVPSDAGFFTVELDNGRERMLSPRAELRVNTIRSCVRIVVPPQDLNLTPGQDATFRVVARGYPLPQYQWQRNGFSLVGETNATFTIPNVDLDSDAQVTVQVRNDICFTSTVATLTVSRPPELRVTEVMTRASTNTPAPNHRDWWELTNLGSNAVSLRGYRYDDAPGVLTGAFTITNDVVVQPGESVVLISDMTREEFRRWWGEENLPENLQIIPFAGNSFDPFGDAIFLWNATATRREDLITSVSFVNDVRGVSLWFDPLLAEFGEPSVLGERGAFRAVEGDDIGSPGWIADRPPNQIHPRFLAVHQDADSVRFTWKTQPGRAYEVQYCENLTQRSWQVLRTLIATEIALTTTDRLTRAPFRIYRIKAIPDLR